MKTLQLEWTKHISDPQRREDFEKTVRNSSLVLDRIADILTEWEQSILTDETSKNQYSVPAWDKLQAHRNGNREIIKRLKDLVSL